MSNKHSVAEVESHGLLHDQKKRRTVYQQLLPEGMDAREL